MDHIHDKSLANLCKLMQCVQFPEYVKTAELNDSEDLQDLPKAAFADPDNRLFPIHTKADTWASAAYLYKYGSGLTGKQLIEAMIEKAAKFWEISEQELAQLKSLSPAQEKTAAAEHSLSLEQDGKVVYKTAIQSPEDLQIAAKDILDHPQKYTYDLRKQAAEQIISLNAVFKAGFEDDMYIDLEKTAGIGSNTASNVASIASRRAVAYKDLCPELSECIDKVAKDLYASQGFLTTRKLQKVVRLLDAADRITTANVRYSDTFQPPELEVFKYTGNMLKTAMSGVIPLKNGTVVDKATIEDNSKELRSLYENVFNLQPKEPSDFVKMASELSVAEANTLTNFLSSL